MGMILARPVSTHRFCESDVDCLVFCEGQRFRSKWIDRMAS